MQTTDVKGYSLSLQQARLWALQRESQAYYAQCVVQLDGTLDMAALVYALQSLVRRHEILRTTFRYLSGMEIPVQVVTSHVRVCCPVIDLEHLSDVNRTVHLHDSLTSLQWKVPNREADSPLLAALFRLSSERHLLLIHLPALCTDGYALSHIIREINQIYVSFLREEDLNGEPLQYADIAEWQDQLLKSEEGEGIRQYWRKVDLSPLATLRLPFERKGSTQDDHTGKEQKDVFASYVFEVALEERLAVQINYLAQQYRVSIDAWLLACWEVALWRLSGKQDLVIGVACDGRNYEELTGTLGLHTRFVPVGARMKENEPFCQMATSVHTSILQAIEWQTYFTWEGASASDTPASDSPPLFFPICFEYEYWPAPFIAEKMTFSLRQKFCCVEPFLLKLSVLQVGECLQLEFHYDSRRICIAQLRRLAAVFQTLLEGTIAQPQASVSVLPLLKPDEQVSLVRLGSMPTQPLPAQRLHQLFEEQVRRLPNQLAVIGAQEHLTYQQLNERANQLAQVLQRRGVGPNVLVGLCLARNAQMLVGLLAILKAGGAYLPLDPIYPPVRLTYQLQESQALLLLTQQEVSMDLPEWGGRTLCLEELEQEISQASARNLPGVSRTDDLAYVIYTSGSTGASKGVMIQQGSVVNYTLALCELLGAEPGWQYATVSTLAADLGNTAIFCALASGGCVQVLDSETLTSAEAMARWAEHYPIDVLKIVPSHLSALLTSERAKELVPKRALVLGGEALPLSLLERLRELGGTCQVYNHYGPTETTVGVLVNELGRLDARNEEGEEPQNGQIWMTVPLGRPITNSEVYVLDDKMQLVPVGVTGELYLGGAGLALGYIRQPEQTAERFVPHPWSRQAGARLYRTGDLAYYSEGGKIEFAGRCDSQVKLRGYRIELGEIEAVLRQHPQVWDCAVLLQEEEPTVPKLISYVVARTAAGLTSEILREMLRKYTPEYMVPSHFVMLETLPLTPNGKVDRRQLPKPEQTVDRELLAQREPRSPIEEMLVEIWRELLKVPALGIHDNFFAMGGHSLLATRLMARVRTVLGVELPVRAVFDALTVVGLAQRVEQVLRKGEEMAIPPLVTVERPEKIPLSFAQQRLWFLDQLEPGSPGYLRPSAHRLQGVLQVQYLEQSLEELIRRHESLRTTFALQEEQPVQVIHPASYYALPMIDLQGLRQEQREAAARRLASQEEQHPCDLEAGPLLRVYLLRLETQEHVVLLTLHHIITDGWSNEVLVRELTTLYHAFVAKQPSPLTPLPIQYADYALWQRQWLQGEVLEAQLAYWRKQLAGVVPLNLPTDYPRPVEQTYRGAIQSRLLPRILSEELTRLSRHENVTLFMTLLAAFQVLLARYSSQKDIAVGTPIANRNHAEIEGVVGLFVNTLVLRTKLSGNPTFLDVLKRVREVALGAYAHQDIPFEKVVQELEPERDLSRSPLFQVMFVLQNTLQEQGELVGMSIKPLAVESTTSKFDLTLSVTQIEQGLHCVLEYSTDLFEADTITRMLGHWQILLEGVVHNPLARLSDLPLLTEDEREQLLVQWNATQRDYPWDLCVHQLFEQQVQRTPDAVALVFEDKALTYADLNRRANQLAYYLQRLGVSSEVLVGICIERCIEMVVGLLGILKACGGYLPLDPSYPTERLAFMLQDARAMLLLTQEPLKSRIPTQSLPVICLDTDWPHISQQPEGNPEVATSSDTLAYVIYTSGSTGDPKGICILHMGINRLLLHTNYMQIEPIDRIAQASNASFDAVTFEIWGALLHGAQLVGVNKEVMLSPQELALCLNEQAITVLFLTTALFNQVASQAPWAFSSLHHLLFGGEAVDPKWVRAVLTAGKPERLLHVYGPTESTTYASWYLVESVPEDATTVPIGYPLTNTQFYVLNQQLEIVPVGVSAELYIGGDGLARGYLNGPELTAKGFVPDPFSGKSGARLYRTGDVVRYLPDGAIEFLGRMDQQVKLRGYRIELGEIEAILMRHPAIQECVVLVREDEPGERRLVAYPVLKQTQTATIGDLRSYLQDRLPAYMIPSAFVLLDALPLTPNGKVDRRALPVPGNIRPELIETFVGPRTSVETILATIWSQVLRVEQVGIHDNFFALGGDSILSIQVVARAKQAGLLLTPKQIFQYQSITQLCSVVTTSQPSHAQQAPVTGPVPLTPIQHWFLARHLPEPHHFNQSCLLETSQPLRLAWLQQVLWHLVLHHDALRLRFIRQASGWQQDIAGPPADPILLSVDLSALSHGEQESVMAKLAGAAQASLDLRAGLLLRALFFVRGSSSPDRLLLIIHHLAVDGVSWRILLEDLETLYWQLSQGEQMRLADKTTSWQQWVQILWHYAQSEELQSEQSYWLAPQRKQMMPLPMDISLGSNTVATSATVSVSLNAQQTRALLQEVPPAYHTQINDVLLTALVQAFAKWTGQRCLLVDLEGHGREEFENGVDLSRTVGWFTTQFPVLLNIEQAVSPGEALTTVKEQLRQMPQKGLGYGLLRYMNPDPSVAEHFANLPQAQVVFNYLGQFDSSFHKQSLFHPAHASTGSTHSPLEQRSHLLEISGSVVGEQLHVSWQYSQGVHRRETIQRLAQHFIEALADLIAHCRLPEVGGYTPSDFPLAALDQLQLDLLIQHIPQTEVGRPGQQIEDIYPLSPMQAGLLFHSLYAPEVGVYCVQFGWTIQGLLNREAWQWTWQHVVNRHPILRTLFVWQGLTYPLQVVCRHIEIPWEIYDWRSFSAQELQHGLDSLRQEQELKGLDLGRAPLVRFVLARLGEQTYYFQLSLHHLLMDGWSQSLFLGEVQECYQAFCQGKEPRLASVRPYRDYIAWLQRQDMQQAEQFWRAYLAGFTSPSQLPGQSEASNMVRLQTATQQLECSALLTSSLQEQARQLQLTLNTFLQGAWALLLGRYSGEQDVVFGATTTGRPPELTGVETMVGVFINTLPVRVRIVSDISLSEWLHQLQAEQVQARYYEYTPLVQIQTWGQVPAGQSLFESLVVFQNYPVDASVLEKSSDVAIQRVSTVEQTHYPLMVKIIPKAAALTILLQYDEARFEAALITRMLHHLQVLLQAMVNQPERRLGDLPLLSAEERHQLLVEWNATRVPYPENTCIYELFEQKVEHIPEGVAVVFEDKQVTYFELNRQANQLAHHLQDLGVGPEVLVGICIEHSIEMAVGVLAILKAGGVCVPLDPNYPKERLAFMLADAHISILLTQSWLREHLSEHQAKVVFLESDWGVIAQGSTTNPGSEVNPEHLAYVIYTSGSTGNPKGIGLPHRVLVNLLTWHGSNLCGGARTLQFASLSFDASFHEMFAAWCSGGVLCMVAESLRPDRVALARFISEMAIEKMILPVVMLQQLAEECCRQKHWIGSLKEVIATGEQLQITSPIVEMFGEQASCALYNHYGPSETHVVTAYRLRGPSCQWPTHPAIGRPIANTQIYVLDEQFKPVPVGIAGELFIGGVSLARGYLDRPEMTAERFIPNPFSQQQGERLYKTGDRARYRADGHIEYLGRLDHQVKIRGYRVELGEIESVLNHHPAIHEVVVLACEDDGTREKQLVAYVVLNQEQPATSNDLRGYLQARLPDYMVPSFFVVLDALPLTPNGKVDRGALPRPDSARPELEVAFVSPRTPAEEVVAGIWSEILRVEQMGIYDNFFELGGHSLRAMQVISRLGEAFQIELPLRSLFERPTIDGLVSEIAQMRGGREIVEEIALVLKEIGQLSEEEVQNILYK